MYIYLIMYIFYELWKYVLSVVADLFVFSSILKPTLISSKSLVIKEHRLSIFMSLYSIQYVLLDYYNVYVTSQYCQNESTSISKSEKTKEYI